jgi:uncharacterized heparinase superfamily protein
MLSKIKKVFQKPPSYVLWRLKYEVKAEMARFFEPAFAERLTQKKLLSYFGQSSIHSLWSNLAEKSYITKMDGFTQADFEAYTSGSLDILFTKADAALNHKVTMLGLEDIFLGSVIDWGKDYKTNTTWPKTYFRSIDYVNFDAPSDVKIPWEISRFQWMMPLGQAYLFTKDEKYAEKTKDLLLSWIEQNPFTKGVNWACTMEVAIRIVVLTWFFHVFKNAISWQDEDFRFKFLKNLFLHAHFTIHHLEKSDVNGNHYIADAMGLVFAGFFFGQEHKISKKWSQTGLDILLDEIQKQIYEDGVDYEASTHYHRLVFEIFYLSQQYASLNKVEIPSFYTETLIKMADYTAHYTQPDGMCPLIGDNDDARILPFGLQEINDHRYVTELAYLGLGEKEDLAISPSDKTELYWYFEKEKIQKLATYKSSEIKSKAFPKGGYYIMRHGNNHVFICCAPLGLKGRGGHSHNDALSFELVLNGEKIITDSGSYVYTADYKARNKFRSTSSHNTPYIDDVEINSFLGEKFLWSLKEEAKPLCLAWEETDEYILFKGRHYGYQKLDPDFVVEREIRFDIPQKEVIITDSILDVKEKDFLTILHLEGDLSVEGHQHAIDLKSKNSKYHVSFDGTTKKYDLLRAQISNNYGACFTSSKILFSGNSNKMITMKIQVI